MSFSVIFLLFSGDSKGGGQRKVFGCSNYPVNVTIVCIIIIILKCIFCKCATNLYI